MADLKSESNFLWFWIIPNEGFYFVNYKEVNGIWTAFDAMHRKLSYEHAIKGRRIMEETCRRMPPIMSIGMYYEG